MELLVAYQDDPAGNNMAKFLSQKMRKDGEIFRGESYDLLIIPTPAISADWLEENLIMMDLFFSQSMQQNLEFWL
jgi:D-aminoacyl-tRNA deacylase